MLLFDRLYEKMVRTKCIPGVLEDIRTTPVYDLSNVYPLFEDWEKEMARPIPRRPPHERIWCEWKSDCFSTDLLVETGLLMRRSNELNVKLEELRQEGYVSEAYNCMVFLRGFRDQDGKVEQEVHVGNWFSWVVMNADYTKVRAAAFEMPRYIVQKVQSMFHVGEATFSSEGLASGIWPAFMTFALMNCKNVVIEENEPDPALQHRVRKAGNPPRVTFKTLRLEMPATVVKKQSIEGEDSGPKVRFHLCRGHFKNLQHDRYKNKGWHWWPAHFKGAKELGEIHKRYSVDGN